MQISLPTAKPIVFHRVNDKEKYYTKCSIVSKNRRFCWYSSITIIDVVQTDIITIQRVVYSLSFHSKMIIGIIACLLVIILLLLLSLIKYAIL